MGVLDSVTLPLSNLQDQISVPVLGPVPQVQFHDAHASVGAMNGTNAKGSQLLTVSDLTCERGGHTLFRALSFGIGRGELLHIEGHNGSGKSTLLRCLCGFFRDWEGEITWDLQHHPVYLGHKAGVSGDLSVDENIAYLLALHNIQPSPEDIEDAVTRAGLLEHRFRAVRELSEGQRKRVSLSRLGLLVAEVWLLDEPFASLDAAGVDWLMSMITDHRSSGGAAIYTNHQAVGAPDQQRLRLTDFSSTSGV